MDFTIFLAFSSQYFTTFSGGGEILDITVDTVDKGEQTLLNVKAGVANDKIILSRSSTFASGFDTDPELIFNKNINDWSSQSKFFLCITNNKGGAQFALYERQADGDVGMINQSGIITTSSLSTNPRSETMYVALNSTVANSGPSGAKASVGKNFDYLKFEMHFDDVGTGTFENYVRNAKF